MKVMCVKKFVPKCNLTGKPVEVPDVLDEDIVVSERTIAGVLYYSLERFPRTSYYEAAHFAILPDDTADEVDAGEKEAIVNLEIV